MQFWHATAFTAAYSFDVKAVLADAMPMMGHLQPKFPYLSCCNRRGFTSTLLIPSDLRPAQFLEQPLRSGADDARDPRAIFLGSPTGDLAAGARQLQDLSVAEATAPGPAAGVRLIAFMRKDRRAKHCPAYRHSCRRCAAR